MVSIRKISVELSWIKEAIWQIKGLGIGEILTSRDVDVVPILASSSESSGLDPLLVQSLHFVGLVGAYTSIKMIINTEKC